MKNKQHKFENLLATTCITNLVLGILHIHKHKGETFCCHYVHLGVFVERDRERKRGREGGSEIEKGMERRRNRERDR